MSGRRKKGEAFWDSSTDACASKLLSIHDFNRTTRSPVQNKWQSTQLHPSEATAIDWSHKTHVVGRSLVAGFVHEFKFTKILSLSNWRLLRITRVVYVLNFSHIVRARRKQTPNCYTSRAMHMPSSDVPSGFPRRGIVPNALSKFICWLRDSWHCRLAIKTISKGIKSREIASKSMTLASTFSPNKQIVKPFPNWKIAVKSFVAEPDVVTINLNWSAVSFIFARSLKRRDQKLRKLSQLKK